MAYLDPNEAFDHFRDRTLEAIGKQFPVDGINQVLSLERLEVPDELSPDDIRSQHHAKVNGQTWGVPIIAHLALTNKQTGEVTRSRTRIAELPKVTGRHSHIVNGQEYQVDNQWQLKPGAYVRRRQTGQIETMFQSSKRPSFDVTFDDASKEFKAELPGGKAIVPLYPLLSALGVHDDELERAWGKDILQTNKSSRNVAGAVAQYYKTTKREEPKSHEDAVRHLVDSLKQTDLRPESTDITLGKPIDHVNGDALLRATKRMLAVQRGEAQDDRDSLVFKDLRSVGDFSHDKIMAASGDIRRKMQRKINKATSPRDVVPFEAFNKPIRETFFKNSAAQVAKQINPVEMVSTAQQTTVMGPGGIQSEQQILDEVKFVNASHMGFLDPIHTPEGSKTGVTLRMPISVTQHGHEPRIPLYNMRTGKTEQVGPATFLRSKVVLPDQVTWDGDKPVAKYPAVKWSTTGNEVADGHLKDADYVMKHSSQFFNITSNLIPFVNNTSGGRASMATRHMEQSISLLHREAPMVQVGTGSSTAGSRTFEEIIGSQASHRSPVSGTVKAVKHDAVVVTDHLGKDHEVQVYRNYPLNDAKSVLDSTILVKPGDKVKASQVVADTNFSRNGTIALGTNLRVGYIPYKGYNFEDGVVISESAAKKLSSVHLYKHKVGVDDDTVLAKRHYMTQHPGLYSRDQFSKIGDNGLAVVGSKVQPGDPLVLSMKKAVVKDRTGLSAIRKSLGETYSDRSLTWEGEGPGEVVSSFKKDGEVVVHVRAVEPMQVGDKMAGRYGNKGIVTKIVPDHEMPHTPDGRHIEVALNPSGVPGRMNIGQVLETAASKIAEKTGKPYVVQNFDGTNQLETIQAELKKHGISDVEDLYDPMNKQKLGSALVGNQHMIKLHHQVDKKVSVRSGLNLPGGGVEKYNSNLQPTGGGHSGGQSMDPLGLYSLLAHGARANIREMQTWKSEGPDMSASAAKQWQSQHHDVWDAIQHGDPLPTPKPTFAFKKFTDMLTGAGINIEKHGHEFVLTPLTNQQIHALTGDRVLPKPAELLYAKPDPKTGEPRPKPGGLFDERLTGGHGGKKWSRMTLAEPVPNPVFAESIRMLAGLSNEHYTGLVHGTHVLGADGKVVPMGPGITGQAGGAAVETLLHKVDIDKDLAAARKALDTLPASKVDKTLKKVKRLQALKDAGLGAAEAYILHSLPIVPPAMRPITVMHDGSFKFDDINQLYSQLAQNNSQLQDPTLRDNLLPERRRDLRRDLYDGVGAVMGVGVPYADAAHKGLIHQIQGAAPKTGYFQSTLISRKQDLSMRSTIVPEPALSLDEIGLPKEHAMKLFSPFVVGELRKSGMALNVADAQSMVAKNAPAAQRALQRVMTDRPVLLKRDPALHKYSVQAFKPRVVDGNAIKIHPLVTGGYNADFDGDTMSVFVPIGQDAVAEAHKMLPSNNLFSEATGKVMYQPTLESALGLYKLSRVTDAKVHHVQHPADAIKLVQTGKLSVNDRVQYGGQVTTTGRILMAAALPEPMQQSILGDLHKSLDKKGLDTLLTQVAREHSGDYGSVADKLKDIGNGAASGVVTVEHNNYTGDHRLDPQKRTYVPVGVHTLALSDFTPDIATREHVLAPVRVEVAKIKGSSMTQYAKDAATVRAWSAADQQMQKDHMAKATDKPSNLMTMHLAGVKPGWGQYKQLTLAPMLVADASGRTIPVPITKSYAEGLDTGDYWNQMHGARRGAVMKVQEVREPGYLSKLLMANTMDMVVNGEDCGTTRGIALPVTDSDVHDRILQKDFSVKGVHIPAGTMLTPNLVSRMRAVSPREQIVVRSPLKCEHAKGVCQKCMGLSSDGNMHQIGENIGVSAAQSLGERAVQLTMRVFHTGGTVDTGGGSKVLGEFDRLNQLMMLPKHIADSSTLAMHTGTIEKIEPTATGVTVYISGKKHHVGKDAKGAPLWKPLVDAAPGWAPPKVGMQVTKGQVLSDPLRTLVNPHDLYKATGNMETVQNYLADQVHALYKGEGIKRKHVETVVKAMSNLTKIEAAGDYPGVLRGEFHPTSKIAALNRELIRAGKTPIEHKPVLKGVDIMPLSVQEDWMAKMQHIRLSKTLLDAAATGGTSNIHSLHPIPGMAYGAEFGLNQEHAKKRLALSHLHDVKGHEY
jgi:DNA-directed RNA polymerase subunit beta'